VTSGSFASAARGRTVGWSLALPPGEDGNGLPVCLVLHGRGVDHTAAFAQLKLHAFLAQYVRAGGRPFALASVDGGDTYWHPRRDGDDPISMITDEFLPQLAALGMQTHRIGALGWSMGGYGALLLARESHRGNLAHTAIAVAAASSPALFPSYSASAAGAFDDAGDFQRYGMLAAAPEVGSTALYVSCGADDAFTGETERYRRNVSPTPAGEISKGCHTDGYWRSVAAAQLSFLGAHLS
jgi:dienelactone hydrolase